MDKGSGTELPNSSPVAKSLARHFIVLYLALLLFFLGGLWLTFGVRCPRREEASPLRWNSRALAVSKLSFNVGGAEPPTLVGGAGATAGPLRAGCCMCMGYRPLGHTRQRFIVIEFILALPAEGKGFWKPKKLGLPEAWGRDSSDTGGSSTRSICPGSSHTQLGGSLLSLFFIYPCFNFPKYAPLGLVTRSFSSYV